MLLSLDVASMRNPLWKQADPRGRAWVRDPPGQKQRERPGEPESSRTSGTSPALCPEGHHETPAGPSRGQEKQPERGGGQQDL